MSIERRPVAVHLRELATGRSGVYKTEGSWLKGVFNDYLWSEGNFACDCNRADFLYGLDDEEIEYGCSDYKIIVDRIVDLTTGETVYEESEEDMEIRRDEEERRG